MGLFGGGLGGLGGGLGQGLMGLGGGMMAGSSSLQSQLLLHPQTGQHYLIDPLTHHLVPLHPQQLAAMQLQQQHPRLSLLAHKRAAAGT